MTNYWILLLWIGVCQSIFILPSGASAKEKVFAQSDIEKKKIEFLLKQVEQLNGAKFWRNGLSYSPKEAADHLRMKLGTKAGSAVKTAKDFIEGIASKSSMSGKPYEIEFENGTRMPAKTFLYKKLNEWKE